ncbi:hypothetical protein FTW19_17780 [Terriglobus albidus]|uniref:Uncharacterized protein n=1 Tax=Terriglobus albidus TaxID=1592106 RepID=A0A5B9EBW8_9BACT|nr:hypothetical protein [Terriglobus albidus]QEE29673.1 hypothetical protein FTW19_17780 [Terriglobus albidus]
MSEIADLIKTTWEILKDNVKITAPDDVNVLPQGKSPSDFDPWSGPVQYPEIYSIYDFFEESLGMDNPTERSRVTLTPSWFYSNGMIKNFRVDLEEDVSGLLIGKLTIQIVIRNFQLNNDIAELQYDMRVTAAGLLSTKTTVYSAMARGDGGGMSMSRQ